MICLQLLFVAAATIASFFGGNFGAVAIEIGGEGCLPPTFDVLQDLLQAYVETRATEGVHPQATLLEAFLNCESVGTVKGQYREQTYTLIYTVGGSETNLTAKANTHCQDNEWDNFHIVLRGQGVLNNDTTSACGRCSVDPGEPTNGMFLYCRRKSWKNCMRIYER